jgi:prolyl-tRNA synthetase
MRYSKSFIPTLREDPAEARKNPSHRLLLRGGYIRQVGAGIYEFLPLGLKVLRKVEGIVRDEMDRAGAQEVMLPALVPAELFKETGRWDLFGSALFRLKDQKRNDYHLGPTHEEVMTDLVRGVVRSYRQLPVNLYQIQWKYRDEARPRAGLLRCREFLMKDAYSFDATEEGALASYKVMRAAYDRVFQRVGVKYRVVAADSGAMGGNTSAEFQILAETGEDAIVVCPACEYAANVEAAVAQRAPSSAAVAATGKRESDVATPNKKTIEEAGVYLFGQATGAAPRMVVSFVRGDRRINEVALSRELAATWLRAAEDEELSAAGLHGGYIGPRDLPAGVEKVLVDREVAEATEMVAGANKSGFHRQHVAMADAVAALGERAHVADVRAVGSGDPCPQCGTGLQEYKGIEGGHIFVLGTHYTAKMGAKFLDESGAEKLIVMGCYGIGVSRLVAATAEQCHDADGLAWPMSIAPYQVMLSALVTTPEAVAAADGLYAALTERGVEVLFDDRDERPGVKFKDADLLGIPLRVTLGKKSLEQGKVEVKARTSKDVEMVDLATAADEIAARVKAALR